MLHPPPRPTGQIFLAAALLAASPGLFAEGAAAQVRGRLLAPSPPPAREAAASLRSYWQEWNGFLEVAPERFAYTRELAVVLVGTGPAPSLPPVRLEGGDLKTATIVVRAGATLQLENGDAFEHELVAEGLPSFSAVATAPGNARSVQVERAGHFVVRDRQHAHVRGHLHALADVVAVAAVAGDGAYEFGEVPPGTYALKVFFRDREVATQSVEVTEARREVTLEPLTLDLSAR